MHTAVRRFMVVVGVLAGALLVLGCPGGEEAAPVAPTPAPPTPAAPVVVAASDLAIAAAANTVQSIEGQTFALANGSAIATPAAGGCNPTCPTLATQPITVTFTNTNLATPTATIVAPNVTGTDGQPARFSGPTTFASCTFVVTLSTFPLGSGPQVGNTITVNPCQIIAETGGVQATGQATTVQILLQLGAVPSAANQATVSINPTTGVVTINNVTLSAAVGSVILQTVTGGTGTSLGSESAG